MVSYESGKKSKKDKKIRKWIVEHPKLFAFLIAVIILSITAICKPDYVEPISKAFVLILGVGL